ncbi:MAG: tetratricopeptide repeat protein, partial [Myxococcota bacterium]
MSTAISNAVPDLATRVEQLKRYAVVVDNRLGDQARATRAWQLVVDLEPRDGEALDALAHLYEQGDQWSEWSEILALQSELYIERSATAAAAAAVLKRAQLLEDRLGATGDAIKALESLLRDLDPSNVEAHKTLRRLYEAQGDFEAAVRVAEREMYLAGEVEEKIARGLEIGLLCRDRLGDPARALQAFDRVLALRGDHEEALSAAAGMYARIGDWPNHIRMLEMRVELAAEGRERRELMSRIAEVCAERLGRPEEAFGWYRRAHEHLPDASTMAELRRAAEAYGLWRELAEVYDDECRRLSPDGQPHDVAAYVAACRELAAIAEHRLGEPSRAINVLFEAISVYPRDTHLLAEAARIAREADDKALWHLLLSCIEAAMEGADRPSLVALHQRRARILEEHLGDGEGAVEELLKAFAWAPERGDTRKDLYELAERTGSWNDVIAVEAALLERATSTKARLAALDRKSSILQDKIEDPVRAFRTRLIAFFLAPERDDTVNHLWSLARTIGPSYREADKRARPEPPPAYVHPPEPVRTPRRSAVQQAVPRPTQATGEVPLHIASAESRPHRQDPTMNLSARELQALRVPTNPPVARPGEAGSSADDWAEDHPDNLTVQLDIGDLEVAEGGTFEAAGKGSFDLDTELQPALAAPQSEMHLAESGSVDINLDGDSGYGESSSGIPDLESIRTDREQSRRHRRAPSDFDKPDPTIELRTEDLIFALGNRSTPPSRAKRQSSPPPFLPGVTQRPPPPPLAPG